MRKFEPDDLRMIFVLFILNIDLSLLFVGSGKTLRDFLEALPREWISEDLMEALANRGVHLSPTM